MQRNQKVERNTFLPRSKELNLPLRCDWEGECSWWKPAEPRSEVRNTPSSSRKWLSDSPRMSAPSSDAGCYESRWRFRARSNSGRAGSPGNGDSDSESRSYRWCGSKSRTRDGRLMERQKQAIHDEKSSEKISVRKPGQKTQSGQRTDLRARLEV